MPAAAPALDLLLSLGATPDLPTGSGPTPLMVAAVKSNATAALLLCEASHLHLPLLRWQARLPKPMA